MNFSIYLLVIISIFLSSCQQSNETKALLKAIDWGKVGVGSAVGGAAGFAGSAAGSWAANSNWIVNGISHPLAKSAVVSPIAAGTGHVAGGTTAGLLQGESLGTAFENSIDGIGKSMAIGGAIGVVTTASMVRANGQNPITLKEIANKGGTNKNVFTVTKEGVVLPKGAKIPSEFIENPHRSSSYGIFENGKFVEKLRIDPATTPGFKGPNNSHFHLNGSGKHSTNWLWWWE